MKRFGGLTHRTWPNVVTTWLQEGTFTTPPDQPYLGFWRHALERSMTACFDGLCSKEQSLCRVKVLKIRTAENREGSSDASHR